MNSLFKENIHIALQNIKNHRLRAVLTIMIVAFGIMALVGILTAIDSLKSSISENFQMMGANTFTITNRQMIVIGGGHSRKRYVPISFKEAQSFKKKYSFPGICSVYSGANGGVTIVYRNKKTNPNIEVIGIDDNYLKTAGLELAYGRNFTPFELKYDSRAVIIGAEVAKKLFGIQSPLGKSISMMSGKYKIVGVLKESGASMGLSSDRKCFITLSNLRHRYYRPNMNFTINFMVNRQELMDAAVDEAKGVFGIIRNLKPGEEENFTITKSDTISQLLIENLKYVTLAAIIIALITLLGASVGLMNIMLVAVSERTREIGVRKALGATNQTIKNQFLVESVVITELGGLLGIFLGIALGNIVTAFTGGSFTVPWLWVFIALFISLSVGLLSGLYPALKASGLNPIEALRFE